jgi:hypothetical protein
MCPYESLLVFYNSEDDRVKEQLIAFPGFSAVHAEPVEFSQLLKLVDDFIDQSNSENKYHTRWHTQRVSLFLIYWQVDQSLPVDDCYDVNCPNAESILLLLVAYGFCSKRR